MRRIDHPPRCRKGRYGLEEERRREETRATSHQRRIHTTECSADDP
jgi:hypothetical protein